MQTAGGIDNLCDSDEYAQYCLFGFPDLMLICEKMYSFPAAQFIGLDLAYHCEATVEGELCANFPEMCDDYGYPTEDVCNSNPKLCEMKEQPVLNMCMATIETCMLSETFA